MTRWMVAALITLGIHTGAGVAVVTTYHPVNPFLSVSSYAGRQFRGSFGYWNRSAEPMTGMSGSPIDFLKRSESGARTFSRQTQSSFRRQRSRLFLPGGTQLES